MRTIDRSSSFKRDYKREAKGRHRATLNDALKPVLELGRPILTDKLCYYADREFAGLFDPL